MVHAAEGVLWSFGFFRQQADLTFGCCVFLYQRCVALQALSTRWTRHGWALAALAATRTRRPHFAPEADLTPARPAWDRPRGATGAKATVQAIPSSGAPSLPDSARPVTNTQTCKWCTCPPQRPLTSRVGWSHPHVTARRRRLRQRCGSGRGELRLIFRPRCRHERPAGTLACGATCRTGRCGAIVCTTAPSLKTLSTDRNIFIARKTMLIQSSCSPLAQAHFPCPARRR